VRRTLAIATVAWAISTAVAGTAQLANSAPGAGLYDPDAKHLWNRVHRTLNVRTSAGQDFGADRLDPLVWGDTQHLLTGASHTAALATLDEFLKRRGELLIVDPTKRAIFQRDLWAIFDWLAESYGPHQDARRALMTRLARMIRSVALTRDQIARLPDTYRAAAASRTLPGLPADLDSTSGPWIGIGGMSSAVPQHAAELSRSAFLVLWRLPGGAADTAGYLSKLWEFPQPFVPDPSFTLSGSGERRVRINPALPPFPDWTQIALVRTALLIDRDGRIVPSRLVESIQLRTFNTGSFNGVQTPAEFTMSRTALFAGQSGGLKALRPDDEDLITFSSKGMDNFERAPGRAPRGRRVLDSCDNCHSDLISRLESVRSLPHILRPNALVDSRHERWVRWNAQADVAARLKAARYDWGVLQALWR
jgi:hypothetical protein